MPHRIVLAVIASLVAVGCATPSERVVCVLDFKVITPHDDQSHLARAIPEFITSELAQTPRVLVQDPQDVDRYVTHRGKSWMLSDFGRLRGLGRSLGTDYFILGSVTRLGENFVIESRLFSVERGHVVPGTTFRQTCTSEDAILVQVGTLAEQLRYQILARTPPPINGQQGVVQGFSVSRSDIGG
jgi:TolB-like protein